MNHSLRAGGSTYTVEHLRLAIARSLVRARVSADALSITGAIIGGIAGLIVWWKHDLLIGSVLFLFGAACDAVDGPVSRLSPRRPGYDSGPMVDCVCDKLGELLFMSGVALSCAWTPAIRLIALAAALGLLTAYVKAASAECGLALTWSNVRIVGRTGRVLILGGGLLFASMFNAALDPAVLCVSVALCLFNATTFALRLGKVFRRGGTPHLRTHRPGM